MDFRYKAFISYRHYTPDQDIAKKLHTYIENYRIPRALRKSMGTGKMGRVFRDQEELPLSSNLGDDIHEALEQSEWLICVCSPRYVQSRWCMEELRYYISLGRRDHILTMLVEGDPETAFPEQLRFHELDGEREEVEPLAADVRGSTVAECLKKLKKEKLRILAPMLGVKYDDLRQRARQRRNRMLLSAGAAVILLLSGFLGYAFLKNAQITEERNAALVSQSKYLAKEADGLLDRSGDRMLALMLAKEALPENFDHPDRPVTTEALYALRSALVSGVSNRYTAVTDFDITVKDFGATAATLAVCSDDVEGYLICYDLSTGKEREYPWKLDRSPFQVAFSYDLMSFIYVDNAGIHEAEKYGSEYQDRLVYRYSYLRAYDDRISVDKDASHFVYSQGHKLIVDGFVMEEKKEGDSLNSSYSITRGVLFPRDVFHSNDKYGTWLLTWILDKNDADLSLLKVDYKDASFHGSVRYNYNVVNVNMNNEAVYGGTDYEDDVHIYAPSPDGTNIIGLTYGGIYVWDTLTEEQVNAVSFTAFDRSRLKDMRVSSAGSKAAVKTENGGLFVYDYVSGEVTPINIGAGRADSFCFNSEGTALLCCNTENNVVVIVSTGGVVEQIIPVEFDLTGAYYAQTDIYGNGRDDEYLLLTGEKKTRLMKRDASADRNMIAAVDPAARSDTEAELTADGRKLWYISSSNLEYYLNMLDLTTGEKTVVESTDQKGTYLDLWHLHRVGDRYMTLSGMENGCSRIIVYDAYTGEKLKDLYPSASGTGEPVKGTLDSAKLHCSYADNEHAVFDSTECIYVFNAKTMEQEFGYQRKSNRQNNNYIFEDGLMLTYCRHNMVLITQVFNTETWQEETQPRSDGFSQFCGILHHASVPGLSDLISVYIHFNKTILMDLRTGETVQLEVDGTDKARLTRDRTGIILRSGLTGGGYYLYDGEKTEKYEPLPEEEIHDDRRDYRFGERWVYFEDGVFHDSETGEKLLDCKGKDLTVKSASENGSCLLLQKGKDRMLILRYLDNSELLELAGTTLEGRELTEAQRQAYFLE